MHDERDLKDMEWAEARFEAMVPFITRLNCRDGLDPQFRNVLVGLARQTFYAFQELRSGRKTKLISRIAPAARSLFELKYWIGYAMLSDANVWRIRRDAMIDLREVFDKSDPTLSSMPQDTQNVWAEARTKFDEKCAEHGVDPKGKHLEVIDMAKELGLESEYQALYRFLSKFVHTSALLICVSDIDESTCEHLFGMGCLFFNEANERLNQGLRAKNLPTLY